MACEATKDDERRAHFTYIWAIEKASILSLSNKLLSPAFVVQTMEKTKWHLEAKFDEAGNGEAGNLMLFICREKDGWPENLEIDFEFSLIENDESPPFAEEKGQSQFQKLGNRRCEVIFNGDFLTGSLCKYTLTVRCQIWRTGREVSQSDLCFARTRVEVEQHSFVWAIKRFSSLRPGQNRTIFLHPTFERLPTLKLTFLLQEKDGKEYGHITVHRNPVTGAHLMGIEVSLLDCEGWFVPTTFKEIRTWITPKKEKVCEFSEVLERTQILSNIAKFLSNDVLSLRCEIKINAGPIWSRIENYRQLGSSDIQVFASEMDELHSDSTANACCPFKKMLKTLHEDVTLSDFSLNAGSQSFSVHKNILGARSPVFKAMFTKDMKEKTENHVDIPDISADTLRQLLSYIYTNRVGELQWEGASNLFRAADKYDLMDLREKCSYSLKANLSSSNACDILVLADTYHDEDLLTAAQDFILQDSEIFYSETWKNFKEEYGKLAFETAEQIIFKLKNSRR